MFMRNAKRIALVVMTVRSDDAAGEQEAYAALANAAGVGARAGGHRARTRSHPFLVANLIP
jgi:hypothetical protein